MHMQVRRFVLVPCCSSGGSEPGGGRDGAGRVSSDLTMSSGHESSMPGRGAGGCDGVWVQYVSLVFFVISERVQEKASERASDQRERDRETEREREREREREGRVRNNACPAPILHRLYHSTYIG